MKKIKTNKLILNILNPDISNTIKDYNSFSSRKKYQKLLAQLSDNISECVKNNIQNPHIQIKDNKERFIFNDSLEILLESRKVFTSQLIQSHIRLDFIYDGEQVDEMYCKIMCNVNERMIVFFISGNYNKSIIHLNKEEFEIIVREAIKDLIKEHNLNITNDKKEVLVKSYLHCYNPKKKIWRIQLPLKKMCSTMKFNL